MSAPEPQKTFIVDCVTCRAKVAVIETGRAEKTELCGDEEGFDYDEVYQKRTEVIVIGKCPICESVIVGKKEQYISYFREEQLDYREGNSWSQIIRVYPEPEKKFFSNRVPRIVTDSLREANLAMQAGANIAAMTMLGRSLEAICRDVLKDPANPKKTEKMMLAKGIEGLKDAGKINDLLFNWSHELRAFRNLAAHDEDCFLLISREEVNDLQAFVHAMIEYIYDLTDRYDQFKQRTDATASFIKNPPPAMAPPAWSQEKDESSATANAETA